MSQSIPLQQENEIPVKTEALTKTSPQQTSVVHTPPTKADIIIDIYLERENLKNLRTEVRKGLRRPSKKLTTDLYITQQILSANKIILYAFKESNININQTTNVDISTQVNELIKISREIGKCKQSQSKPLATT